jgi:hypothetical protein
MAWAYALKTIRQREPSAVEWRRTLYQNGLAIGFCARNACIEYLASGLPPRIIVTPAAIWIGQKIRDSTCYDFRSGLRHSGRRDPVHPSGRLDAKPLAY